MKKIFVFLCFVLSSLLFINPVYAERFYINDYYTEYKVNEDGTINAHEGIYVFFKQRAHGIVKDINKNNDIITHIRATENRETHTTSNTISLKMGDPNRYITGNKLYDVQYKINLKNINISQLRLDIVSPAWNTEIESVNFRVSMPKNINPDDVMVYKISNRQMFPDKNIIYVVKNNVISGYIKNSLKPYEGIVVAAKIPVGYFVRKQDYKAFLFLSIILILTAAVVLSWAIYGKDKHVTPIVTFKPPKEINPMDAGIIMDGYASSSEFIAYLVSLMGKNYIKMEEKGEDFTLKKGSCFNNAKGEDSKILKILFNKEDKITKDDLENSAEIQENIRDFIDEANERKEIYFDTISKNSSIFATMFVFTLFTIFTSNYVCMLYDFSGALIHTFFFFMVFIGLGFLYSTVNKGNLGGKIISFIIFASTVIFLFMLVIFFSVEGFPSNDLVFKIGIFCSAICVICMVNLPKRTTKGTRLMGELLGLKHFIKVAEKDRLKVLIEENPSYFYNILPYAYIFGMANEWITKFRDIINITYEGSHLTTHSFSHISSSLSTSCASFSSGSSSHGGSSGGSHGGGGGHSW